MSDHNEPQWMTDMARDMDQEGYLLPKRLLSGLGGPDLMSKLNRGEERPVSAEQRARDLLERCGVTTRSVTSGTGTTNLAENCRPTFTPSCADLSLERHIGMSEIWVSMDRNIGNHSIGGFTAARMQLCRIEGINEGRDGATITCSECGNSLICQQGETIYIDDKRLCKHVILGEP